MKTAYEILGVSSSSTQEEAKKAHRSLAKRHHPDVDKSPDAHKKMVEINAAWEAVKAGRGAYPPSTAPNRSGFGYQSTRGTDAPDWRQAAYDFEQAMRDFEELVKREAAKKENQEQAERNRRYQEAVKKADEERRRRQEEDAKRKKLWEEEESAYWSSASQKTSDFYKGKWDGPTPAADAEDFKNKPKFGWWDESKEAKEARRQAEKEREEADIYRARTNPFFPKSGDLKDKILWANFHSEEMQEWMYLEMKTGGTDEFSFMNWGMLSSRINAGLDKIVKTKGINTMSAMRWAARGLDADLAIRKVQVDERFYAERGRR